VDNEQHCDFSKLRYMLLTSHLQDLKEITHDVLYEHYRTERLSRDGDVETESGLALAPEMAQQVKLREEQLRREEEKVTSDLYILLFLVSLASWQIFRSFIKFIFFLFVVERAGIKSATRNFGTKARITSKRASLKKFGS